MLRNAPECSLFQTAPSARLPSFTPKVTDCYKSLQLSKCSLPLPRTRGRGQGRGAHAKSNSPSIRELRPSPCQEEEENATSPPPPSRPSSWSPAAEHPS